MLRKLWAVKQNLDCAHFQPKETENTNKYFYLFFFLDVVFKGLSLK